MRPSDKRAQFARPWPDWKNSRAARKTGHTRNCPPDPSILVQLGSTLHRHPVLLDRPAQSDRCAHIDHFAPPSAQERDGLQAQRGHPDNGQNSDDAARRTGSSPQARRRPWGPPGGTSPRRRPRSRRCYGAGCLCTQPHRAAWRPKWPEIRPWMTVFHSKQGPSASPLFRCPNFLG